MYFRDYTPNRKQTKEEYIADMQKELNTQWYARREFEENFSYNREATQQGIKTVKVKHVCIFYNDNIQFFEFWYMMKHYLDLWYTPQVNKMRDKSIKEVGHIHFILELEETNTFTYPV
jgi:hypothetical protein